ncbi:hypothetical protein HYW55_06555 [Candidatus Gottesmanbacteria bacterium]|nr:hypothetical protein [Candidatus Gottesmanbacteria bacterium]
MKIPEKTLSLALAIVSGGYYLLCTLIVSIAPDLYKSVAASWMHGIDAEKVWRQSPSDIGTFVWGFITFTLAAYVTGYIFAFVYNALLKNK